MLLYFIYFTLLLILIFFGYVYGNSDLTDIMGKYREAANKYTNSNFISPLKTSNNAPSPKMNFKYQSKGEYLSKCALEKHFKKEFKNVRPDWLINPITGRKLEIDCFNEELKIALEYNGVQHYKFPNGISKSKDEFKKQLDRDKFKERICKSRGIKFLIVPYTVKYEDIEKYVIKLVSQY